MTDIAELVDSLGGMAHKRSLVRRGARDVHLTLAVRAGSVRRARRGWYTTLPEESAAVRAVRVGGRLTGISAVIAAGGWVLGSHPLHVSVHRNASRLRSQSNRFARLGAADRSRLVLHWDDPDVASRGTVVSVGLVDALYCVILHEPLEVAVAALDWALRSGQLETLDLEAIILRLPQGLRYIRHWVDERCDSLPESLARTRLRSRGHRVRSQVFIGDAGPIDLVVDECIAVETDGEEHHLTRFEKDRAKDLSITLEGLHVLRPSARMVFHSWDRVALGIETAIAARRSVDDPTLVVPRVRRGRSKRRSGGVRRPGSHRRSVLNLGAPP